jgi:hypothetical protein
MLDVRSSPPGLRHLPPSIFTPLATDLPGLPGTTTLTNTDASRRAPLFYRVGLAPSNLTAVNPPPEIRIASVEGGDDLQRSRQRFWSARGLPPLSFMSRRAQAGTAGSPSKAVLKHTHLQTLARSSIGQSGGYVSGRAKRSMRPILLPDVSPPSHLRDSLGCGRL